MAKRRTREERLAALARDQRLAARWLALAGSVLEVCPEHIDSFIAVEGADIQRAYRIGDQMLAAGQLKRLFANRQQMVEAINAAVIEASNRTCLLCEPPKPH